MTMTTYTKGRAPNKNENRETCDRPPPNREDDQQALWDAIFGPGVIERPTAWDEILGEGEDEKGGLAP
jgi:hypothetical protein